MKISEYRAHASMVQRAQDHADMRARIVTLQDGIDTRHLERSATANLKRHAPRTLADMLAMPRPSFVARLLAYGRARKASQA